MKDPLETLGEVAWDVLQRMVRERLARTPGGHLVESSLHQIDLHLPLALKGHEADPRRFSRALVAGLDRLIDEAVQHAAAFRPGHAYCHRCESARCDHSRPTSCRHVFVGYAPTGMPRWLDFAQLCLELRHPEVDRLYDQPPAFLTLVQDQDELHGGLLDAFARGSHRLMGQVAAGFYPVHARAEEGRGVVALSIQAAVSTTSSGRMRVGLNVLGLAPGGEDLDRLWERHDELPWRKSIRWAQSALQGLPHRRPRQGGGLPRDGELQRRVEGILRGLARRLERDRRARTRRTRHAEKRHASGQRPTRKAVDDARTAATDSVLVDERSGALVVLGERGRTHFYTPEGRLVSSVRYSKDAIARKLRQERWRQATSGEAEGLRNKLRRGED